MSDNDVTELVFILDRSGSMDALVEDTIGGYNSLLKKQKGLPGKAMVTTVLFDDSYEVLCNGEDLNKVEPLTSSVYYARGCTALLDAVGRTLLDVDAKYKGMADFMRPSKTMVVIITDGMENSSREYTYDAVKRMISARRGIGWEFVFLGANIDAESVAESIGIDRNRAATYSANGRAVRRSYDVVENMAAHVRCDESISDDWKDSIE